MMGKKFKEILIRELKKWIINIWKEIKKKPLQKIILILISPFLIYYFAGVIIDFSWFSTIGYYLTCIYGFSRILEDPYRIMKWAAGYAIGAKISSVILPLIWSKIQEGTAISIFTILIMSFIFLIMWSRVRELKKV